MNEQISNILFKMNSTGTIRTDSASKALYFISELSYLPCNCSLEQAMCKMIRQGVT
jgi:hypothetical protein